MQGISRLAANPVSFSRRTLLHGVSIGLKRDEVTREWRKRHNAELNDLFSPNIVQVIKQEE